MEKDKYYFFENMSRSSKMRLDTDTRDPAELSAIIKFFEANAEKYGRINASLSGYGKLFLTEMSRRQKISFIEDYFAKDRPQALKRVVSIDYEVSSCHIPEDPQCGK